VIVEASLDRLCLLVAYASLAEPSNVHRWKI